MTTPCPHCQGHGQQRVLACTLGKGCVFRILPCVFCNGTGTWTPEQVEKATHGEALRELRTSMGFAIRVAAKRLGLAPSSYSDLEWGRGEVTVGQIAAAISHLKAVQKEVSSCTRLNGLAS